MLSLPLRKRHQYSIIVVQMIHYVSFFSFSYTFGKPVIGTATVYLSIVGRNGTIPFGRHAIMVLFHKKLFKTIISCFVVANPSLQTPLKNTEIRTSTNQNSKISPHVRYSKTASDSGFYAVDSGLQVLDSSLLDSEFQNSNR